MRIIWVEAAALLAKVGDVSTTLGMRSVAHLWDRVPDRPVTLYLVVGASPASQSSPSQPRALTVTSKVMIPWSRPRQLCMSFILTHLPVCVNALIGFICFLCLNQPYVIQLDYFSSTVLIS